MPLQGPAQQTWSIAPLICYEDLLPDFIRQVGKLHPNLMVNLTSDSWFGADTEPWEHLALAVFATIELRVGMVRAVNSGISALIDPNGRLLQKTYADDPYRRPHAADGIIVNVPRMPGEPTVYVTYGNWFPYLCMAAIVWMGIYARRVRRQLRVGRRSLVLGQGGIGDGPSELVLQPYFRRGREAVRVIEGGRRDVHRRRIFIVFIDDGAPADAAKPTDDPGGGPK